MQSTLARFVCRILIASMMVLPFQARAGLIGAEQAVSAAQAQAARATIDAYIERAEVLQKLQAYGLSPQEAQARVAALSDAEITALAGRIDSVPAGGWVPLLLAAILVIYILLERSKEEAAAKKPAPAPEKK
ncbi:MAG TPA: PA2779 family protein [Burkholderiales bacterium]|nr:PA2779 family protein [Burkholderiales bacterium]